MDGAWIALLLVVLILFALWYVPRFWWNRDRRYWDLESEDRTLQVHVIEKEIERQSDRRDKDLAP